MPKEMMNVLMSLKEVTEVLVLTTGKPGLEELSNRLMDFMAENSIDDVLESSSVALEGMDVKSRVQ